MRPKTCFECDAKFSSKPKFEAGKIDSISFTDLKIIRESYTIRLMKCITYLSTKPAEI